MARLSLQSSGPATASRDRSSRRIQSDSEPGEVSQLSASLQRERSSNQDQSQGSEDLDLPEMMNQDSQVKVEDTELFGTGEVFGFFL